MWKLNKLSKLIVLALIGLCIITGFFFFKIEKNTELPLSSSLNESSRVHVVTLHEDGFKPQDLTIIQGDIVVFKNGLDKPFWPASNLHPSHTIYPEFDALEPVPPGGEWSFQFLRTGIWNYHDHIRAYYRGTITVEAQ